MLTRPGKSKAEVKAEIVCHKAEARVRPKNYEANSEARDVPLVIKNTACAPIWNLSIPRNYTQ